MHCSRAAPRRLRRHAASRHPAAGSRDRVSPAACSPRSTEAQPLNAPSPSVPVRPLIITTEPLSRTSALADSGACNRPGASSVSSVGMFCRSIGGAGGAALISNLSACSPARALPEIRDLAVGGDGDVGVDGLDAVFDAVAQIGKHDGAVGDADVLDRKARPLAPDAAGLDDGLVSRRRSRCSGTFRTGRTITSSVISGRPDHTLASVMSAWMLLAVRRLLMSRSFGSCSVTSFRVTLSDGQSPILVAAVDGELVAGLALDPLPGSARSGSSEGIADHQQQREDDDHGGDGGPGDFQCSHVDIPDRATASNSAAPQAARPIR